MQTRLQSAIETAVNVVLGIIIAMTANTIFIPIFLGVQVHFKENAYFAILMTIFSFLRSYSIRRLFNRLFSHNHNTDK